jgi:hypothetical protein
VAERREARGRPGGGGGPDAWGRPDCGGGVAGRARGARTDGGDRVVAGRARGSGVQGGAWGWAWWRWPLLRQWKERRKGEEKKRAAQTIYFTSLPSAN